MFNHQQFFFLILVTVFLTKFGESPIKETKKYEIMPNKI